MSTDPEIIALLRDSAQRYADEHYDFLQRWSVLDQTETYSRKAWNDYGSHGWLALRLPEDLGGLDADAVAIGAVMEIVGSRLLMEPILASAVVGAGLLRKQGSVAQLEALLPGVGDGSVKLAFAEEDASAAEACVLRDGVLSGAKIGVLHGDIADRLIVAATDGEGGEQVLCMVDAAAAQVKRKSYRLVDGRGAANLHFDQVPAERLGPSAHARNAAEAIAQVREEATVALCAEALGVVNSLVRITNEYLKVRKQFGKPIGSNQALQHRMVDLYLFQQEIRALTRAAQTALGKDDLPAAERTRIVSGAKAYISHAARHVANEAIQMHGGLGVTEELDVSHYFRRLMVIAALFGNRDQHFTRFMDASDGVAAKA